MLYQKVLRHASLMLVVSKDDTEYLQRHFPGNDVVYLPSFHANDAVESRPGSGEYALYNGNIEVPENAHAVRYLIKEVFNDLDLPLIVAGMNPPDNITRLAEQHKNIRIVANPDDAEMFDLIGNAHINILVTFQATGLKLKLLNTLYRGRFCLVNDKMLNGTGLEDLCITAKSSKEFKQKLKILFKKNFTASEIELRNKVLERRYSNDRNAQILLELVFGGHHPVL
jgi:predicted nucleic acid-binding protein